MNDLEGRPFAEALLLGIRERFCHVTADPIAGPRIYLENAGGSLHLKRVLDAVACHREGAASPNSAVSNFLSPGRR